jgi:hypothetical protein
MLTVFVGTSASLHPCQNRVSDVVSLFMISDVLIVHVEVIVLS